MKERGILFSAPMIGPIQLEVKDVTRRIMDPQPVVDGTGMIGHQKLAGLFAPHVFNACATKLIASPFGSSGDRLWVREAWRTVASLDLLPPSQLLESVPVRYEADGTVRGKLREEAGRYRHARFMPRWASRTTLEVVSVAVERLHNITEDDARREGVDITKPWKMLVNGEPGEVHFFNHRDAFAYLWAAINGAESWKANPWVRRVEFKRLRPLTVAQVKDALAVGAAEREAAEKTAKRRPRR